MSLRMSCAAFLVATRWKVMCKGAFQLASPVFSKYFYVKVSLISQNNSRSVWVIVIKTGRDKNLQPAVRTQNPAELQEQSFTQMTSSSDSFHYWFGTRTYFCHDRSLGSYFWGERTVLSVTSFCRVVHFSCNRTKKMSFSLEFHGLFSRARCC